MEKSSESSPIEKYMMPIAVVLGAVLIALAVAFGRGGPPTDVENNGGVPVVNIQEVKTEASPYVGEVTAPVTIAVWFDYQCPFCKRYDLDTLSKVYQDYVTTGKVRIVYKDFQFLSQDSMTAAVYARAVWEASPAQFYPWLTAMMEAQDEEHGGFGDLASIETLTATISGIDVARVSKLAVDKKAEYEKAIAADRAEGQALGINGTPGSIIGTTLISGAETYPELKALIEAELAK